MKRPIRSRSTWSAPSAGRSRVMASPNGRTPKFLAMKNRLPPSPSYVPNAIRSNVSHVAPTSGVDLSGVYIFSQDTTQTPEITLERMLADGTFESVPLPVEVTDGDGYPYGAALMSTGTDEGAMVMSSFPGGVQRTTKVPPTDPTDWTQVSNDFAEGMDANATALVMMLGGIPQRSTDGGQTFTAGTISGAYYLSDLIAGDGTTWLAYDQYGNALESVEISTDDGVTFAPVPGLAGMWNDNYDGFGVAMSGDTILLAGTTYDGTLGVTVSFAMVSTDGGATFTRYEPIDASHPEAYEVGVLGGVNGDVFVIQRAYTVPWDNNVDIKVHQFNGSGFTELPYTDVNDPNAHQDFNQGSSRHQSDLFVFVGENDLVVYSTDQGATWDTAFLNPSHDATFKPLFAFGWTG